MKRPYQVTGVALILLAAFMAQQSLELRFYTRLGPGPGFFPLWVSLILGLLGAIILFRAGSRESNRLPEGFFPSGAGYLRVGAIVLALAGSALLMGPLGFRLTMLAFLLFLLFTLGRQNLVVTISLALLGSFGTYHAFVYWLKVFLPVGMFGV